MPTVEVYPEHVTEIPLVCAWCGRKLGSYKGDKGSAQDVSHGICPECRERVVKQFREEVQKLRP